MRLCGLGIFRKFAIPDFTSPLVLPVVFLCLALLSFWPIVAVSAQETQTPPESPGVPSTGQEGSSAPLKIPPMALFVMLDKKSIVFPDIAAGSARMSAGQKFKLFVDNSVSLHTLALASMSSAMRQATDSPSGYGQGADGYGKRFGSSMARVASSNFFGTFLLASALHQDPRFFAHRYPTFGGSMKYAAQRLFVTRNDEGEDVTNWSGLAGPLLSEGLANAYWPEQDRTAGQTLERYGTDLAARFAGNMLREYWPALFRRVGGSRHRPTRGN